MAIDNLKSLSRRLERYSARNGKPNEGITEIYLVWRDEETNAELEPVLLWKAEESDN